MSKSKLSRNPQELLRQAIRYRKLYFLVLVALVYGFVIMRIMSLRSQEPNQTDVSSATTVAQPHIDQATVNKIKQLQDNSVNVQALFNQARQNPFQE